MAERDQVPLPVLEEILDDMATDGDYLRQFLAIQEGEEGDDAVLRDPTVDRLEEVRDQLRRDLGRARTVLEQLPQAQASADLVAQHRLLESRLFDVEDLLERMESFTFARLEA